MLKIKLVERSNQSLKGMSTVIHQNNLFAVNKVRRPPLKVRSR